VSTSSQLAAQYPGGLIKTSGTSNLMKLSGTSMAAGVVTGAVAAMLDANRTMHPGAVLTPNAVKAILQYSAFTMPDADPLTQGAGSLNAAGAIILAAAIDPSVPSGAWWLTVGIQTSTTVAGESLAWGQRIVWGDRLIWGNQVFHNDPAWALRIIWGNRLVWGNRLIWGNSTVFDGNQLTWGSRLIWGNTMIGENVDGTRIIWGNLDSDVSAERLVWGNLRDLKIAPTAVSWGNLERSNMDIARTTK
jgi:hypothetical protein